MTKKETEIIHMPSKQMKRKNHRSQDNVKLSCLRPVDYHKNDDLNRCYNKFLRICNSFKSLL